MIPSALETIFFGLALYLVPHPTFTILILGTSLLDEFCHFALTTMVHPTLFPTIMLFTARKPNHTVYKTENIALLFHFL
jgi:hypothetical protein